jgi:hypothetical protein
MDTQDTGPMNEEAVHSKFVSLLSPTTESDRESATEEEQGEVDTTTEEVELSTDSTESDESEATEAEAEQPEDPVYTVKVNGEEKQVTLSELQKGYMMQSDYSRKTQEIAEARKAVTTEMQEAQQQRQQALYDLNERVSHLDQLAQSMRSGVDLEQLRDYDPSEYLRQKENLEKVEKARDEQRQFLADQQRQYLEQLKSQEHERLLAAIPDWLDGEKAKAGTQKVRSAMVEYGFTDPEVASVLDHRLVRAFHDLAQAKARITELESKTQAVKQQVKSAPPLSKPQAANAQTAEARKQKELREAMRKGKDGAAAEAFKRLL